MTAQPSESQTESAASQSRRGDPFLEPRLQVGSLDNWLIRTAILRVLVENVPASDGGMLLDVGCGHQPYRPVLETQMGWRYVGVDIAVTGYSPPDVFWDGLWLPFRADSASALLLTEVLEHCPEPASLLAEVRRVVRPGATVVATTPFLWPLHDVPYDVARYSPFTLKRLFEEAGFAEVRVWSTGGWHQAMAQMLGLWARRGPMGERKRAVVSRLLVPVVRSLARRQSGPVTDFHESQMPTTLAIVAS